MPMVISFKHDHIVPPEAARPLAEAVGADDCTHRHLPGGHVPSVTSGSAEENLWPQITEWLAERDAPHEDGAPSVDEMAVE